MIIGGGSGGCGTDMTTNLINLKLLEGAGLLDKMPTPKIAPKAPKVK